MADSPKWRLKGDFYGNCSCAYLRCPCPTSNFTETPTMGFCRLAIIFYVEEGQYGQTSLDDRGIVLICDIPGPMADGNWTLGLVFDERCSPEQQQALGAIMGGQAGGPMVDMAPWIGNFAGAEVKAIDFTKEGYNRTLKIGDLVDLRMEGTLSMEGLPVCWDNVWHPANRRVYQGKGVRTKISAFGVEFEGEPNKTMGAYTTFDWKVA